MSSRLKETVRVRLAFNSCNRCGFPRCDQLLTADATEHDDGVILGEAAHIRGEKPGAARYDPEYPPNKLNSYENLIFLCPDHHTQIDKQPASYPVETLLQWKEYHEAEMRRRTGDAIADVGFAELDMVTQALLNSPGVSDQNLHIIPPNEKISKNELSDKTRFMISLGLGKSPNVKSFMQELTAIVPHFDENLVGGFRAKYDELFDQGLRGDALFNEMHRFACTGKTDAVIQAAGLAVLSHLFETCDVFEK